MVKIVQHNANTSYGVHQTTFELALEVEADFLLLQEPYCFKNQSLNQFLCIEHQAFYLITPQNSLKMSIRPRVLTYVRKEANIEFTPRYDLILDPDLQIIEVNSIESFYIVNLYNEKEQNTQNTQNTQNRPQYTINRLLYNLKIGDKPRILVGDFNLHHFWWNPTTTIQKAQGANQLVSWLFNQQASLLVDSEVINNQKGTFYRSNLKEISVIDLAFTIGFKLTKWGSWHYLNSTGSDHEAICFESQPLLPPLPVPLLPLLPQKQPKYNYKKANWDVFDQEIEKQISILQASLKQASSKTIEDLDSLAASLTSLVQNAANLAIPKLKIVAKSKPWWTDDLKELRKDLNRTFRAYKKGLVQNQVWKDAQNKYYHLIRQAKNSYWESFLNKAKNKDIFTAYKITKDVINSKIPLLNYQNQGVQKQAKTFEDKCSTFLTTLFPTNQISNQPADQPSDQPASQPASQPTILPPQKSSLSRLKPAGTASKELKSKENWPWPELSKNEVEKALSKASDNSAAGPDQLGYIIIKRVFKIIPILLYKVYKTYFEAGYHPKPWKQAIGFILPKANKIDYTNPKSYRVINLLNCFGKVLEKIYANRFSYLANTRGLLHNSQIGGQKQRSAIDAALLLLDYIQDQKNRGKITTTIFLDIKGAFDYVQKGNLLAVLDLIGLPETVRSWVSSFTSDRKIQLAFDGQLQQLVDLNTGIPQGSPVSPILFLIYIRFIYQKNAYQLSYIDDFCLSTSSKSTKTNCKVLEQVIKDLFQQASEIGVEFAPEKTELIHFGPKKDKNQGLLVGNLLISPKEVVRWLGIWFDTKLSFKTHVQKRLNLAIGAYIRLQRLGNTQKGLSFKALRQLYIACIASIADYGSQLWWSSKTSQNQLKQLQQLQNQALNQMLGAFKGSPQRALELEAGILPPEIRLEKSCLSYAVRTLKFLPNHPIRRAYISYSKDELAGSETEGITTLKYLNPTTQLLNLVARLNTILPKYSIEKTKPFWEAPWLKNTPIRFSIQGKKDQKTKENHQEIVKDLLSQNSAIFYTDGSQGKKEGNLTQNGIGICQIGLDNKILLAKAWNLGPFIEVADAEVFAIYKVLKIAQKLPLFEQITIFVDSQAAIQRIKNHSTEIAQKSYQLAEILDNKGTIVEIRWCPSHIGIFGNELADRLAKKGLKLRASPESYISLGYIKRKTKEKITKNWRQNWKKEEKKGAKSRGLGKLYQAIVKGSQIFSLKPTIFSKEKRVQAAYIQLKTGIGYLKTYQKRIGKVNNSKCVCFCKRQSTTHLVLYCPKYQTERKRMATFLNRVRLPLTLQTLFCTKLGKKALEAYLLETGICTRAWFEKQG